MKTKLPGICNRLRPYMKLSMSQLRGKKFHLCGGDCLKGFTQIPRTARTCACRKQLKTKKGNRLDYLSILGLTLTSSLFKNSYGNMRWSCWSFHSYTYYIHDLPHAVQLHSPQHLNSCQITLFSRTFHIYTIYWRLVKWCPFCIIKHIYP